jgi:glycosyltransferase 2 family protein
MNKMGRGLQAGVGLAVGAFFLWLALRGVSEEEIRTLLVAVRLKWVALALALYAGDLLLRIVRWHALLNQLLPVSRIKVAETLVVGYAFNNLLPARLGELFRADYAKRQFGVSRSAALGSIAVERLLDGLIVVACLAGGLIAVSVLENASLDDGHFGTLLLISVAGAGVMGLFLLGIGGVIWVRQSVINLPAPLRRLLVDVGDGIRTANYAGVIKIITLSLGIWLLEGAALWSVVRSVDIGLTLTESSVLLGAASLSTLVPTAPGFLGSYQFVFAISLSAFGLSSAAGIVAASVTQVFLLGSVTVTGIALYMSRSIQRLVVRQP